MIPRICFSVLLLFSILFLPFWVSIILAISGIIYFYIFLEAVFIFFISDLLYGAMEAKLLNTFFFSFSVVLIFLILMEILKKKLKFYKKK
jgi:hypothetical protein